MKIIFLNMLLLGTGLFSFAQDTYKQTIRGIVLDKQSQMPLQGANVIILNSDPINGTITDVEGNFRLEDVPVCRQNLQVSFVGYNTIVINNLLVNSAKELVLTIGLEEKVTKLGEVVVKAMTRKDRPMNEMALISARSFTIEETERYAGSWGDPARMVSNYAGVVSSGDQRNDIIIRGNSPLGLLWRLDGINIPNPNHFGTMGTTGGPISILNNNLLTNSDFFTAAFPAEYGNALSGVFDLKMRTGNTEKREYLFQMGFNGFELGAEGPFSKKNNSSYLINYRYTMMGLMDAMGIFDVGGIPKYQDLSFKFNFPTKKIGKISLFGIGGLSHIELEPQAEKSESAWTEEAPENTRIKNGSNMGVVGLSHLYFFNNNSRIKTDFSISANQSYNDVDSLHKNGYKDYYNDNYYERKLTISSQWNKKINVKSDIRAGGIYELYYLDYFDETYQKNIDGFVNITDINDFVCLYQLYGQWSYRMTDKLRFSSGLHGQFFNLNQNWVIEPRISMEYNFSEKQTVSLGYGLHSQLQPRLIYFTKTLIDTLNSVYIETNRNLDFSKSNHFVAGYNIVPLPNFRIKLETYYQYLFDIPIEKNPSVFSMLNYGATFYNEKIDSLVNEGTGKNYGIELTVEKFFNNNYYFLITTSFYESKYTGSNDIEYNTVFNCNYAINVLAGYEFNISKNNILAINLKNVYAGGKRYIPINIEKSLEKGTVVYNYEQAYNKRYDDYFRLDLRISLQRYAKNITHELAFDVQNVTDHENIFIQHFDVNSGNLRTSYQTGFFPIMFYKLYF